MSPPILRTPHHGRRLWLSLTGCAAIALVVALVLVPRRQAHAPERGAALPLDGRWVPSSLTLSVNTLLADPGWPTMLLAGTADGVWRSGDGGALWHRDAASPGDNVYALAASSGAQTLLAGASDGRVYARSGAAGGGWRPISPILRAYPVFSLAVAPDGHSAIAGTTGALYRGQQTGNAWQWRPVHASSGAAITSIVWTPWDPRLVFATIFDAAPPVLASRDGGRVWRPDAAGLPPTLPTQSLHAGGPVAREIVLSTMGGGVWLRAPEGGWHDISAGLPRRHAMPLAGDPGGAGTLFAGTMGAGVYARQEQANWRPLGYGLQGSSALILSILAPSATHPFLLAGTAQGLFRYLPLAHLIAPRSPS